MRRKLVAIVPLILGGFLIGASAGTCGNGYSFSRQINLMRAVGSDQSNFVVSLTGVYAPLKSAANGGQVQNTTSGKPADLVFCDASNSGNAVTYYPAYWDASTGSFSFRILVSTLHTGSTDSIWLFTNNSSVTTAQYDGPTLCSTAGIKAMYPMDDNAGNTTVTDVCGSSNGTAGTNTSSATTAGQIDKALGTSAMRTTVSATSQLISGTGARTLFCWFKTTNTSTDEPLCGYGGWSSGNLFDLYMPTSSKTVSLGGFAADVLPTGVPVNNGFYHMGLITYDNSASPKVHVYSDSVDIGTGSPTLNTTASGFMLGGFQAPSNCASCTIDETWLVSGAKSANWVSTMYKYQAGKVSAFQIVEPSYLDATITNYQTCWGGAIVPAPAVCTMPFSVTSGGVMVLTIGSTDTSSPPPAVPTDTLGLTYTLQSSGDYTGTLHHYYEWIYTAPITATGVDTITTFTAGGNISMVAWEIKATTVSGIATASVSSASPPSSISATCSSSCFLMCDTHDGTSNGQATTAGGSLSLFQGLFVSDGDDHPAAVAVGYGPVSSGSQSCALDHGAGAAMVLLPIAPASANRKRPSQVY